MGPLHRNTQPVVTATPTAWPYQYVVLVGIKEFPVDLLYLVSNSGIIGCSEVIVRLDERDRIHKKKSGHVYEKNGFLPAVRITDFPLRDRKFTLIVRRRRWYDVTTGEIISNDYDLVAKGTRHSVEFAAF